MWPSLLSTMQCAKHYCTGQASKWQNVHPTTLLPPPNENRYIEGQKSCASHCLTRRRQFLLISTLVCCLQAVCAQSSWLYNVDFQNRISMSSCLIAETALESLTLTPVKQNWKRAAFTGIHVTWIKEMQGFVLVWNKTSDTTKTQWNHRVDFDCVKSIIVILFER